MNLNRRFTKTREGFSLIELIVTVGIIGILAGVAIPTFSVWMPNYRLRSAAQDLFSALQLAKMEAVKTKVDTSVLFNTSGNGSYTMPDGTTVVNLADYKSDIRLGKGNATKLEDNVTSFGSDFVITSPDDNKVKFNSRGMVDNSGFIYIQNDKKTVYAIGSRPSGVVLLKKWDENDNKWK